MATKAKAKSRTNRKQMCRDLIKEKKSPDDIKKALAQTYIKEGENTEYAKGRANSIFADISRERKRAESPEGAERKDKG